MKLDPETLRTFRDRLLQRGRPSVVMSAVGTGPMPTLGADKEALMRRLAPIAEVLYLMMAVDGQCEERERDVVRGAMRTLSDGMLSGREGDAMMKDFDRALLEMGREERLFHVAGALSGDRQDAEIALSLAAVVAVADGEVAPPERALLEELASLLGLSPEQVLLALGAAQT